MTQKIYTFGCRLNSYESEVIRDNLKATSETDVAVFNTCAVTKEAERQAKQAIRKHAREHPQDKIIVTGCAAQIAPDAYADITGVSHVLGNQEKLEPASYNFNADTEQVKVNDIMSITETAGHLVGNTEGRARAFMQVQNGCNHRCTFCIIPYGRGNSRSVPVGEVVRQAELLHKEQGFNELVLTGVDMTDYGKDLPGQPRLGELVKRMLSLLPTLPRLRLSSIDVAEIDDDLMELICHEERLMPHLHLSLQSGDNMILKRMKRRHTREQVQEFAAQVWQHRPDMVFGADIIAGFPTETDAMFEQSRALVEELQICHMHSFPYSEREGTPAASIPENKQVPVQLRKQRAAVLRKQAEEALKAQLRRRVGQQEQLVVEQQKDGSFIGRTAHFFMAELPHQNFTAGEVVQLTTCDCTDNLLRVK